MGARSLSREEGKKKEEGGEERERSEGNEGVLGLSPHTILALKKLSFPLFAPRHIQSCRPPSLPPSPRGKQARSPSLGRRPRARALGSRSLEVLLPCQNIALQTSEESLQKSQSQDRYPPSPPAHAAPACSPGSPLQPLEAPSLALLARPSCGPRACPAKGQRRRLWRALLSKTRSLADDAPRPRRNKPSAHPHPVSSSNIPLSNTALSPRAAAPWSSSPAPRRRTSTSRASTRSR